jgi:hypothetical protein
MKAFYHLTAIKIFKCVRMIQFFWKIFAKFALKNLSAELFCVWNVKVIERGRGRGSFVFLTLV